MTFRRLDATKADFPENHFDLLYSRDAIMHIADKDVLYANAFVSQHLLSWAINNRLANICFLYLRSAGSRPEDRFWCLNTFTGGTIQTTPKYDKFIFTIL